MLPLYLTLAVMLATSSGAYAQGAADQSQESIERPATDAQARRAIPRGAAPRAAPSRRADDQRRARRDGDRQQGDNPRIGTPVPRAARRPPVQTDRRRGDFRRPTVVVRPPRVVVRPPAVYNNYYNYPRRRGPLYGYGAFGLGYGYRDPYQWYPGTSTYVSPGYYGRPLSSFDTGELRLQISPRHAQVYVDGYYAGTVDGFDGAFQSLTLESGPYQIEIAADGYETMTFNVRISPGQKLTYRSDLIRRW